ncbi:uncharacterized protein J4E87_007744 [Alternaria ethzedia]|uniref:uncharacterized protein n=1 Tax=Alternaria ethzedia TaxID=181014 RepID=UPI0020C5A2CD|nr:uncharacterized protein J4E87_007744 [Alternaria ethzedia]KAI4619156.1 hypothetical protein J4E87_007744 [Alternaria ethzedia]
MDAAATPLLSSNDPCHLAMRYRKSEKAPAASLRSTNPNGTIPETLVTSFPISHYATVSLEALGEFVYMHTEDTQENMFCSSLIGETQLLKSTFPELLDGQDLHWECERLRTMLYGDARKRFIYRRRKPLSHGSLESLNDRRSDEIEVTRTTLEQVQERNANEPQILTAPSDEANPKEAKDPAVATTVTELCLSEDHHGIAGNQAQPIAKTPEELAMEKAQKDARQFAYRQRFLSRRYISMLRVTRPRCPREVVMCHFDIQDHTKVSARDQKRDPSLGTMEYTTFDRVFAASAPEETILDKISPLFSELADPTGSHMIFGVDGFSGCGKSHTMAHVLTALGQDLFASSVRPLQIAVEVFQSSGRDVDSLDISATAVQGLRKSSQVPLDIGRDRMFRKQRPLYIVNELSAFRHLLEETASFRNQSPTKNNATSSRTHLVVLIYVTSGVRQTTSTLCLLDLAGSERNDAAGAAGNFEEDGRTNIINNSRMNIHLALEAGLVGIKKISRETSIGTLLQELLIERNALLIMLFHVSVYTQLTGAVLPTLSTAERLNQANRKHRQGLSDKPRTRTSWN